MQSTSNAKTTVYGIIAAIGTAVAVVAPQIEAIFDGDPATNPNWQIAIGAVIAVLALFGLGKSAKDAPAKPE